MDKKEIRSLCAEVRASPSAEETIHFEGKAVAYDSPTEYGWWTETVAPGACANALKRGDDVRLLKNHDPNLVLARTKSKTLTLEERDDGLYFSADAPACQWVKDFAESVKRGDIDQCSFAFAVTKDEWEYPDNPKESPKRTILDMELFDVSIVTYPAYQDTEAVVRSAQNRSGNKGKPIKLLRMQLDLKEKER